MATVVVPFRSGGKSRLPAELRVEVSLAMLRDVLAATVEYGARVRLVTDDAAAAVIAAELGVEVVDDPGGGQGAAVQAGLAGLDGICLVVNADVPRVQASDLAALGLPPRRGAVAIVAGPDGTTNALGLPFAGAFEPLFGPGSAARFRAHATALGLDVDDLDVPRLRDDVDTIADLDRVGLPRVNVVVLSGGVGGAKLAAGLHDVLAPGELTVIGNVGDDLEVLGLHVSPDLDSVLYGLAGLNDIERGWGRAGESWQALESVRAWGGEDWFMLGDLDLGVHLVRSQALRGGEPLSAVTAGLARAAGLATRLVPATDDRLRTHLVTPQGTFAFQEWFVARRHEDAVDALVYEGADTSRPAPGVLDAIAGADAIVIAPSNPFVSIHPILAVPGIRAALENRRVRSVAVSPLIGGRAVRGPLDRMMERLVGGTTPAHVTKCYKGLLDALVIDRADAPAEADTAVVVTDTLIRDREAARRLAQTTLEAAMEALT